MKLVHNIFVIFSFSIELKDVSGKSWVIHPAGQPFPNSGGVVVAFSNCQLSIVNRTSSTFHSKFSALYSKFSFSQGFLYAPFGEITTEYAPLWQNGTLPKYAFNAKELDEETGMYYYEARYYKPPVFISRDPLMSEKPWLTPYNYCSNNPVGRVDPSGCEDMDNPIISTNGKLLGVDDNGWGGIPIIMDENIYNDLSSNNKKKISHSVAESKGQYLNVYDKGIKISDKTWTEIENHGGDQRLTPYVQNRSNNTVYYKPEGKVNNINMNPGHSTSEALPIAPYTDLYVPVDGVATTKYSDNVLKIPTGYTITITPEGGGRIHGKGGDFIRIASGYGWVDEKWLKEQQKKGDTDWNALFNKAKHIGKRKY